MRDTEFWNIFFSLVFPWETFTSEKCLKYIWQICEIFSSLKSDYIDVSGFLYPNVYFANF